MYLVLLGLARHKVPVRDRDGAQAVLGHRLDHRLHEAVLVGRCEALHLAALAQQEAALLHNDLGGPLRVYPVAAGVQRYDCAHRLPGGVERVHFLEPGVRHLASQLENNTYIHTWFQQYSANDFYKQRDIGVFESIL